MNEFEKQFPVLGTLAVIAGVGVIIYLLWMLATV